MDFKDASQQEIEKVTILLFKHAVRFGIEHGLDGHDLTKLLMNAMIIHEPTKLKD